MKNIITAAVIALSASTTTAMATPSYQVNGAGVKIYNNEGSYFSQADIGRDGFTAGNWDSTFATDITDAWDKGYTGQDVRIAIIESDNGQVNTVYNIGNYIATGGHRDRMARAAGGVWIDASGNVAAGVARDAHIDVLSAPGSTTKREAVTDFYGGTYYRTTRVPGRSNTELLHGMHDILSASYSSRYTPSRGFNEKTGEGFDIVDVVLNNRDHNKETLFVTSAGNTGKHYNITDANVTGMLAEGLDKHLLIVTGVAGGNSPDTAAKQARTITAPYIYQGISGTSHATAVVSGMTAIVMDKFDISSTDAADRLLDTADSTFSGYNVRHHGQGKVDLSAALSPVGSLR